MVAQWVGIGAVGARPVVGEIVAVTTTTFTAQSYALNEAPPFGALLRIPALRAAGRRDSPSGYDGYDGGRLEAGAPSGYDECDRGAASVGAYRIRPGAPGGYRDGGQATGASSGHENGAAMGRSARRGGEIAAYYALCCGSETGSIEPGRHAVAWGRFEDGEDDIYRRHPQLTQVLRTTFDALLVGFDIIPAREPSVDHRANGHAPAMAVAVTDDSLMTERGAESESRPLQRVPATPPRLHAMVYAATPEEVVRFNGDLTYLRFVLRANLPLADDFIAAAITHAYEAGGCDEAFLLAAARTVARLLGAEHERVMNILELLDG